VNRRGVHASEMPTARARKAGSTSGPRPGNVAGRRRLRQRAYDVRRVWEVTHPAPSPPPAGRGSRAGRSRAVLSRRFASRAPGATTRCWRTGTAWRSPPWRAGSVFAGRLAQRRGARPTSCAGDGGLGWSGAHPAAGPLRQPAAG
jgi:hypothetical protein